ncbi:Glutamate receptor 2.2 [Thalictrum thalictroides]|uniref:Glutamate receptor 2.2 n=1 Tax=Thalictrum thalictroides TaxID=46969 RepID=A0A7J6VPJ0_THATH|nr:Glutamate receptor 2.2 [Thalictrum thalictroides]
MVIGSEYKLVVMDRSNLIKNGDFVGYQKGSFAETILKELNANETKLMAYNSPEEYDEALHEGSKDGGGIAAIFYEPPYIQFFINNYSSHGSVAEHLTADNKVRRSKGYCCIWTTVQSSGIPMKKLKIGVPVKDNFREFVGVHSDPISNETLVTGFCIDVFNAVMEALPYIVPYEFVPFQNFNGESVDSYNDLVHQVYLQKYDAVVGDIAITSNRSLSIKFSRPYTYGGVSMVIPVKYNDNSLISYIYLVADFSLPMFLLHLTAMALSLLVNFRNIIFPFPQNIFQALKTRKFVLFISMAVVLFYCEQYMPKLRKQVIDQGDELVLMDVNTLIRNGDFVGYQKGSFVKTLLKELNFDETKLVAYNSPEEYDEALRKGSKNGGVAAIFDEMPYIQLFINKYCGNYTEGPYSYKICQVFEKGSPLVDDVSNAIFSEKWDKIKDIEKKWFGSKSYCHDPRKSILYFISPPHLTLFWWLFIIVLIVVLFSLVLIMFLYIVRNSAIKLWKHLVDRLQVQHTTENDNNNTVVSVNPDLTQSAGTHKFPYVKESKQ